RVGLALAEAAAARVARLGGAARFWSRRHALVQVAGISSAHPAGAAAHATGAHVARRVLHRRAGVLGWSTVGTGIDAVIIVIAASDTAHKQAHAQDNEDVPRHAN